MLKYLIPEKDEIFDFLIIILVISLLFSITISQFEPELNFIPTLITVTIFISILLISRLIIMKLHAYKNAFKLTLYQTKFSRYGPRKFDTITAFTRDYGQYPIKEIPSSVLAILIYILTFGFIVFPGLWRYKREKIPHRFIGTMQKYEYKMPIMYPRNVTDYRVMKTLFVGYIYYFFSGILIKHIFGSTEMFYWLFFINFWIAGFSLLPIIGTEGYDFFKYSRIAYYAAVVILLIGSISILLIDSIIYTLLTVAIIGFIVYFIIFYKYLL